MKAKKSKTSSIEKALRILMAFSPNNPEMGTVTLSRKLGFHPATVNRILMELSRGRFLQKNPLTRKFTLGPSILNLGSAITKSLKSNIVIIAKPYIDDLRDTFRETAALEVLSGNSTVVAYVAEGPPPLPLAATIGDRLPMAAAGAKAILAFSPPQLNHRLLVEKIPRLTPKTVTDRKALRRQLEEIRRQGYAFDNEEIEVGINAVAAPIFNHEEKPVAAIVVAGPSQRITVNSGSPIVAQLKDCTSKISNLLFYSKSLAEGE
ncbi:MAG: IclR family transcriptional regulator [Thermodesulfobacteriota bacterium]|jgi:DNA-binding IclR family transcriptional regulator